MIESLTKANRKPRLDGRLQDPSKKEVVIRTYSTITEPQQKNNQNHMHQSLLGQHQRNCKQSHTRKHLTSNKNCRKKLMTED